MVIQKKYIASRKGHIVVSAIMNVTENLDFLNIFKPSLQDKIEPARNFKLAGLLSCFSYYPSRPSRPSRPRARWSPAATWEKKTSWSCCCWQSFHTPKNMYFRSKFRVYDDPPPWWNLLGSKLGASRFGTKTFWLPMAKLGNPEAKVYSWRFYHFPYFPMKRTPNSPSWSPLPTLVCPNPSHFAQRVCTSHAWWCLTSQVLNSVDQVWRLASGASMVINNVHEISGSKVNVLKYHDFLVN